MWYRKPLADLEMLYAGLPRQAELKILVIIPFTTQWPLLGEMQRKFELDLHCFTDNT